MSKVMRSCGGVRSGSISFRMASRSSDAFMWRSRRWIFGAAGAAPADDQDPSAQVCSCNDVTRGAVAEMVAELGPDANLAALKKATRAGTGCGGCEPLVKSILGEELDKLGVAMNNDLCEHFAFSRSELVAMCKTHDHASFEEVLAAHGHGDGCEVCKPTVAGILATLRNEMILDGGREGLQDTNDRALANMQRGGSYSVIPRMPGGEVTPAGLIAVGEVAAKYNLFTKVTGAQRIDLLGAAKHDLPDIWEQLNDAGFESGHAYGKALRTVKSCVGSTWCRYGVADTLSLAVRVENRYKGFRSPHKLKSGVSGCVRECAEAQCKDFGMIATENGFNLYVGGNGGAIPVHGALLAADIDEETMIRYLDRFLMYYSLTAERLERTAPWLKRLPGGVVRLREIIIDDALGLNAELEARMQHQVDTYKDEWAEVVADPARRARFKQFVNTDAVQTPADMIAFEDLRGQPRPVNWPADGAPQTNWRPPVAEAAAGGASAPTEDVFARSAKAWVAVGRAEEFAPNTGSAVLYGETQLAVFNNAKRGEWFATQNMCPHKQAFVLSQGLLGDAAGVSKVACPLHKKTFDLACGDEILPAGSDAAAQDSKLAIFTFPVRIVDGVVEIELPPAPEVDAVLGTSRTAVRAPSEDEIAAAAIAATLTAEVAALGDATEWPEIGRASCRERV